jgi:hypothetical protein
MQIAGCKRTSLQGAIMADDQNEQFFQDHAGQWVAWDRRQTHVVASGTTFDAVKAAAAEAGEQSVLVARIPTRPSWLRRPQKLLSVFAVFIALGQPAPTETSPSASLASPAVTDIADGAAGDIPADDR